MDTPSTQADVIVDGGVFIFPASFAQRGLWFLDQLQPSSTAYVIVAPFEVTGPLDARTLERVLDELVRRHESLRTRFAVVDHEPVQCVAAAQPFSLAVVDLGELPAGVREAEAGRMTREETARPFDLMRGPLFRATLVRERDDRHLLLVAMHHIISDGWSVAILMREAAQLYDAFAGGLPVPFGELPIQYGDYSVWQRQSLDGAAFAEQVEYWQRCLAGAPAELELPAERSRGAAPGERGAQQPVRISADVLAALKALARRQGATLYMGLLAAFHALLHRHTGQEDLCVGSPVAGRTRREVEGLIGLFVNTLVMRGDLSGAPGFQELLGRVKETTLGAFTHQDVPFEKVVEALSPEREPGRTPLFQALFVLQNVPAPSLMLGAARLKLMMPAAGTAKFAVTLNLEETGAGGVEGYLEYAADRFLPVQMRHMAARYERLLAGMVANPEQPVGLVPMLAAEEWHGLLHEWNGAGAEAGPPACLHELFEQHAERDPEAVAAVSEAGRMTYADLNARANRLARFLRDRGVGPEARVAMLVEPSLEMMVGVLAVLKAGGAYVPIDPGFPRDRIAYILDQARCALVLTTTALRHHAAGLQVETVDLETPDERLPREPSNLPRSASSLNAAYVIYTSGSTGAPKGVVVEHRQIVGYARALAERLGLRPGTSYAMVQPLAVDACNTVLIPAICMGGALLLAPRSLATDAYALAAFFARERVDVLKVAPSHLAALLDACPEASLMPHQVLALGGEASRWDWIDRQVRPRARPGSRTFIHYGPTETTVGVLTHPIERRRAFSGALAPLGAPLSNSRAYVLSPPMVLLPANVTGEIYIGGASVARGYLDRPELTATRFVPDPFAVLPGSRMYRTGDLGRWLPDGAIEFLGRADYQIKVRGFRVELGEIESTLLGHPAVHRSVAIARDDDRGEKRIWAYVTSGAPRSDAERRALQSDLDEWLRERLPEYMIPFATTVLDALPVTAQGKVDLRALPAPAIGGVAGRSRALPQNATEARVGAIWEEVLNVEGIGTTDDFFRIGGHSLTAVRLLARVRERFGRGVSLADFVKNPTVAQIAKLLAEPRAPEPESVVVDLTGAGTTPFFCVHPIGGSVACYVELARLIGQDRPIRAFQARAGDRESLEELAASYARELRRQVPDGPFCLGGWSFGGLLAFEMARQLEMEVGRVDLLAIFDTYPPRQDREPAVGGEPPLLLRLAADVAGMLGRHDLRERDAYLCLDPERQKAALADRLRRDGLIDSSETGFDDMLAMFSRHARAADEYRMRPIRSAVDLFVAGDGEPGMLADSWARWTPGGLRVHVVSGDHYSIVRQPAVRDLAARLEERFAALQTTEVAS